MLLASGGRIDPPDARSPAPPGPHLPGSVGILADLPLQLGNEVEVHLVQSLLLLPLRVPPLAGSKGSVNSR